MHKDQKLVPNQMWSESGVHCAASLQLGSDHSVCALTLGPPLHCTHQWTLLDGPWLGPGTIDT